MRIVFAATNSLGDLTNPAANKFSPDQTGLEKLVGNLVGVGTIVAGLALIGYFIFGAVRWSTAGGDKAGIEEAKKILTNAIIGLVIAAATFIVVDIVQSILGIDIISPRWSNVFAPGI